MHHEVAEFYYVMKGEGTASLGGGRGAPESVPIKQGDALPILPGRCIRSKIPAPSRSSS